MRTPARAGRYTSFWRLATADGRRFGHRLWCSVHCEEEEQPVVEPVAEDDEAKVESGDDEEAESMLADIERSFAKVGQSVQLQDNNVDDEEEQAEEEGEEEEQDEEVEEVEEEQVEEVEEEQEKQEEVKEEEEESQQQAAPLLFASQARQLQNMGFADGNRNATLLQKHSGDVLAAVQELLADH